MTVQKENTKTDGEKLRAYIEMNLINQSELVRRLGVGRTTYYRWLNEPRLHPMRKKQFADLLDTTVGNIWGYVDDPQPPSKVVGLEKLEMLERALGEVIGRMEKTEGINDDHEKRLRALEVDKLKRGGGKGLKFKQ